MADESRLLKLEIVCPDRVFFEGESDMVEMKTTEGEIGVYKNHIPMTSILLPGILTIHNGSEIKKAALHDGFVEIFKDRIVILAESAEWPDEIDVERAQKAKERAEKRLTSGDEHIDTARAELALRRALIRLEASHLK